MASISSNFAFVLQTYFGTPLAATDIYTTLSFCVLMGKTGQLLVQSMGNVGMVCALALESFAQLL